MENLQIEKHLADSGKRFFAYLIDILPITLIVFGTFYLFFDFDTTLQKYFNRGEDLQPRIDFLAQSNLIRNIVTGVWIIYCIFMESSANQGTLGKKAMGIKVIDAKGNQMSIGKSIWRNASKILCIIPFALGFLWILFDKQRQGWHDKLNGTFVVAKNYPGIVSSPSTIQS